MFGYHVILLISLRPPKKRSYSSNGISATKFPRSQKTAGNNRWRTMPRIARCIDPRMPLLAELPHAASCGSVSSFRSLSASASPCTGQDIAARQTVEVGYDRVMTPGAIISTVRLFLSWCPPLFLTPQSCALRTNAQCCRVKLDGRRFICLQLRKF